MRALHAAACIEHGGDRPQLVIIGGVDTGCKVLKDVWIMDVQSRRWEKVTHALRGAELNGLLIIRMW